MLFTTGGKSQKTINTYKNRHSTGASTKMPPIYVFLVILSRLLLKNT